MIDTIIAFGCSVTYGDELLDPNIKSGEPCSSSYNDDYRNSHCYAGIVADHYNLKFVNTAAPGGSLESMRYALYWASQNCDLDNALLVVGLTQAHRQSYFDASDTYPPWNPYRHSAWLTHNYSDSRWGKLNQYWLMLSHCEEWEKYNLYQTIKMFEGASSNIVLLPVFLNELPFESFAKADFILEQCVNKLDYAPNGHPNEGGHQKIANRLIKYIDSVKLV